MTPPSFRIPLVKDTVSHDELDLLGDWVKTHPRLTIGGLVREFEDQWSDWLGVEHSVMVNSGSSANLALIYSLLHLGRLKKGDRVLVPAVSWVTTVAPLIQLGLEPILVDASIDTLGVSVDDLERLSEIYRPKALLLVHVLGIPCEMYEIRMVCRKYGMILLEDSCESVGSTYLEHKTGTFGLGSTFSFYMGHHLSTVEGGMISTNDQDLADTLRMVRSHGWNRDLDAAKKHELTEAAGVDPFRALYTFYLPGFNLRPTEIQGFLGQLQMKKVDQVCQARWENLQTYDENIRNFEWKLNVRRQEFCSNFAYPVIHTKVPEIAQALQDAGIETRPLVCGSIARQPFWTGLYPQTRPEDFPVANRIHDTGLYLPNNHEITRGEILEVCAVVNSVTDPRRLL